MKKLIILAGILLSGCSNDLADHNRIQRYIEQQNAIAELKKLECIQGGGIFTLREYYDSSRNAVFIKHWECMNTFIKANE